MAIPPGTFSLAEGASQLVSAFCMDFNRPAPELGTTFDHVLGESQEAHVLVGERSYGLQEAIDRKIVAIEGQQLTFSRYIAELSSPVYARRMTPERRLEIRQAAAEWSSLSRDEQAVIEQRFASLHIGDYSHLRFRNLLPEQQVKLVFGKPAVVGTMREQLGAIDAEGLRQPKSTDDHQAIQRQQWTNRCLAELGYLGSGESPPSAISSFQKDAALTVDGKAGPRTLEALHNAAQSSDLNATSASTFSVINIELRHNGPETAPVYIAYGRGSPPAQCSDLHEILDVVDKAHQGTRPIYIQTSGFTRRSADGLASTMRIRNMAKGAAEGSVQVIEPSRESETFFLRQATVERPTASEIEAILSGPNAGKFETRVEFNARGESFVFRVVAALRDAVKAFLDALTEIFSGGEANDTSLAIIVNTARARAASRTGVSEMEIRVGWVDELGHTQWVIEVDVVVSQPANRG
jgi:hypothetical protein